MIGLTPGWETDVGVLSTRFRDGVPIGKVAASNWLYVVPDGIRQLLKYIKQVFSKKQE